MPLDKVGWVTKHLVAAAVNEPVAASAWAKRSWARFMVYLYDIDINLIQINNFPISIGIHNIHVKP